ncbi:hypothetical protein GCK32_016860 [Trichostrongylus colubriformis]|uniref:Uncharacterized protein n=1 Tax=Trichostrongylus colubriformis TaxID=6319 RepID=A0AAN8FWY3_TRICO
MVGLIALDANCMLILPLLILLHVMACSKSRTNRASIEPTEASKSAEPRRPSGSQEESASRQRRHSSQSRERKPLQRAPETLSRERLTKRAQPVQESQVLQKAPSKGGKRKTSTIIARRRKSLPTIEADFEPGALDQQDLLAAAEEMAKDAGGYENMDPNEEVSVETKTARMKRK